MPAELQRFPTYERDFNPSEDTSIDVDALDVSYVHFKIEAIGARLTPAGGLFSVSGPVKEALSSALVWFLLPLDSVTLLFIGNTAAQPHPPHTIFVRWEGPEGRVHTAYFE